jgi:hypothetical protein
MVAWLKFTRAIKKKTLLLVSWCASNFHNIERRVQFTRVQLAMGRVLIFANYVVNVAVIDEHMLAI